MSQSSSNHDSHKPRMDLHGDALLKELRHGWAGLPNKTLLALAMGGLRVRMMRSTVTMLSIVLAIAFLTYTGLSSTVSFQLVQVAERLGDQGATPPQTAAQVQQAVARVLQLDLLADLDTPALKAEAMRAGLDEISTELAQLPIATRGLERLEDAVTDNTNKYETLVNEAGAQQADINLARSQMQSASRERDAMRIEVDELQAKVALGQWINNDSLPPDVTQEEMASRTRQILADEYRDLVANINTSGRLSDESLRQLDRPLTLAQAQASQLQEGDIALLRDAINRISWSRQSESLFNMLRRSGVNVQKTREGNPMDIWLIVMAMMTCAVGIANAMLMSVTERFREIGTMKCLGAQDNLVVKLFLLESAFLGVIGAAGGIIIGVVVSLLASVVQYGGFGLSYFPVVGALPTIFWSVLGGMILSVAGAVYPAYAASRMQPVDALRVDE